MEDKLNLIINKLNDFDDKFARIDERFDEIDSKFGRIDERFDEVDSKFEKVDERLNTLEENQRFIKSQQEENTDILKSLLHRTDIHNAKLDNLNHQLAEVQGDVKQVKTKTGIMTRNVAQNMIEIEDLKEKV